ncbi:MAG: putative integral membrane protein [Psychromonas sp.]|jgi:uncharacterized integral membrane protein|uniref:DUF2301 domain-containing membrane protein n=1 Tax=Psychromonas sp. TaxID=1884585 RepID=UPI0039E6C11E
MANPEHVEVLDTFDRLSVCMYRTGISLFPIALLSYVLLLANELSGFNLITISTQTPLILLASATALSSANLHVYDKKIRAIISLSGWIGLLLSILLNDSHYLWIAQGFMFFTFSGIALKESFCFKVAGLKITPALLCLSVFMIAFKQSMIIIVLLFIVSLIFVFLAQAKWRMPLHFDIGNKANYQI